MKDVFCHYKDIINCEFLDCDDFSRKLVHYYKTYVSLFKVNSEECLKKAKDLDKAMFNYIEDYHFSKELRSKINIEVIVKDDDSYLEEFIDFFVSFFKEYNPNKRVKPVTRWI